MLLIYRLALVLSVLPLKLHLNIIKILASITKNPNSSDGRLTPIHCAAMKGHVDIIKFLVSLTTDDHNTPDYYGDTPIHAAAVKGYINVLKLLAPLTKNPNGENSFLRTPIQLAQEFGRHEFARLLQSFINTGHF